MSGLTWHTTKANADAGSSAVTTANVYDTRYARLTFGETDVRAIYVDWDDGSDNSKEDANYQWLQYDYPISSAVVTHTYTQSGTFKPVIQTVNSQGIFSKYFSNESSNSFISPHEESSTIASMVVSDKAATSVINLENKQVLSGIDNSYFDKYGAQDIYFSVAPTLSQGDLTSEAVALEIEAEVVYGMVSGSEGAAAGGSSAIITIDYTSDSLKNGNSVAQINTVGGETIYKVRRINKIKWVNSRSASSAYSILDAWNKIKVFILTTGSSLAAGGSTLIPYYPIAYVTDGMPIKKAEDSRRVVNFDMSQSRTAASNTSLTNYRYDNGKNWFVPANVWESDATKLTAVSGTTAGTYQSSFTYTPRPDGLMQKGITTDANSDYVLAFGANANLTWYTGGPVEPRVDQFLIDEFNRFVPQGHLLRTWVSGNGGTGSEIDTYDGIFRISPALNWDVVGSQLSIGGEAQSICKNYEDLSAVTPTYTVDITTNSYNNTAANTGMVDLDAINTLDYEDRKGNDREAYEYVLLIADKKHNKIYIEATPYAKDLMYNVSGGINQNSIAGLYYLHADKNRTNEADIYWKPLKFQDGTKSTKDYRDTSDDKYITTGASLSKSGFIEFDEPTDWSAVSMYDLMGQNSDYAAWGTAEGTTVPVGGPTPNQFEFVLTGTISATGTTSQGKTATFVKSGGVIPTALSGNTEGVGAYKYLCIAASGSGGNVPTGSAYWVANAFGNGYDGTNTFTLQIGDNQYDGGGAVTTYGNFTTSSVTYVMKFRRINWYDVIDGASKIWSTNPTGAAAGAMPINNVDSKDGQPWPNRFSFMSGSAMGTAMNSKWGSSDKYAIKMVLKGNKYESGAKQSSPATGNAAGVVGTEVWNILPYDNSFSQYVEELDDHAYALTSIPITSDISVGRKGNYYEAITRKGRVYLAKTGISIEKISFSSVALGDESNTTNSQFDSHGPGTLYGYLKKVRDLQANSVRVYWDEQQKDGTYIRFWGIITDVQDTRGASGPRSVVNYTFNMTVEEIALYDGTNNRMMTDIFPLGGIEDVRTYS